MPIILRLDRVMADRKITLAELAQRVGIANGNLSNIKTGKISAIRFSTLEAICDVLDCQPGDLLEYWRDGEEPVRQAYAPEKALPPEKVRSPYEGMALEEMWETFLKERGWDGTQG